MNKNINRASFDFGTDGDIIWVEDYDQGKSVTNDMENVIQDLITEYGVNGIKDKYLIYLDTTEHWDYIQLFFNEDGSFQRFEFKPLRIKNYIDAKKAVKEKYPK